MAVIKFFAWTLAWIIALGSAAWAFGALYFDFPITAMRTPVAIAFAVTILIALFAIKGRGRKLVAVLGAFVVVLLWWFTIRPGNDRPWQADVAQTARAEIDGDVVTIHNVRNCDYRSETDYTPRWEERRVRLSQLVGVDLFINYWGSPWMAHPIASFEFADAPPICFSIETRKENGESYSAIGGLYRQYELIYVCADERDVVRVRTNYRKGEDVYLYRTAATPDHGRQRFLEYLETINTLHEHPRWYNAVTTNCTTSIRSQHATDARMPWDWRILVNGKMDEMMYENHLFAAHDMPFAELKRISHINERAKEANDDPEFSRRIREGLPGF